MSSIAETVSPFTMEEEIIYCQKFTSVYKEHQHDSAASREAACLEVQYPACMCPPQPGDLLVGRYYHPLVLFSPQACSSLGYCFDEAKLRRWENSGQLGYAQRRDLSELEAFWKYENTNQYIRSHDTPLMKQWLSHEDFTKDRAVPARSRKNPGSDWPVLPGHKSCRRCPSGPAPGSECIRRRPCGGEDSGSADP